jgi:hypothetical protein
MQALGTEVNGRSHRTIPPIQYSCRTVTADLSNLTLESGEQTPVPVLLLLRDGRRLKPRTPLPKAGSTPADCATYSGAREGLGTRRTPGRIILVQ